MSRVQQTIEIVWDELEKEDVVVIGLNSKNAKKLTLNDCNFNLENNWKIADVIKSDEIFKPFLVETSDSKKKEYRQISKLETIDFKYSFDTSNDVKLNNESLENLLKELSRLNNFASLNDISVENETILEQISLNFEDDNNPGTSEDKKPWYTLKDVDVIVRYDNSQESEQ